MKILCKIAFTLSMVFLVATVLITLMCSFLNRYIIIGSVGTDKILAILATLSILFFSVYLLTKHKLKNLFTGFSLAFLVLTGVVLLVLSFYPKYNYSTHISDDNIHTVVVEEKSISTQVWVHFYKKSFGAVYEPIYSVKFTDDKKDDYKFGDYILTFDDQYTSITVPLFSSTEFLLPHSN